MNLFYIRGAFPVRLINKHELSVYVEIRFAMESDLDQIAKIFRIESAKEPYFRILDETLALEKVFLFFENYEMFVAIIEKEIIAFVTCELEDESRVYLSDMWMTETYQHKGFGTKFIEFIEENYKSRGFKELSLVSNKHSNAFKFYSKLGFKEHNKLIFLGKRL
jgi:ribosomal protein S18 acetylase RimI-like enzyme